MKKDANTETKHMLKLYDKDFKAGFMKLIHEQSQTHLTQIKILKVSIKK